MVSKERYNALFRKYRKQGNNLLKLRNILEDIQLDLDKDSEKFHKNKMKLDSVQNLINTFFNDENKLDITKELHRIANELTMTDYQSLDSEELEMYELKKFGDWETISNILSRKIKDAEKYIQEGIDNKNSAETLLKEAEKDLAKRYKNMESAIETFKMLHQNDSVSKYYKILVQSDTMNWKYLNEAGIFEQKYLCNYQLALSYYLKAEKIIRKTYGKHNIYIC